MVRPLLTAEERERGRRLGILLRDARAEQSMTQIAARSGVPVETLRKIEAGRIPTPAFFTVAALAAALDLRLEEVAAFCAADGNGQAANTGQPVPAGGTGPRAALIA